MDFRRDELVCGFLSVNLGCGEAAAAANIYMLPYCSIDQPAWIVITAPEFAAYGLKNPSISHYTIAPGTIARIIEAQHELVKLIV